MCRKKLETLLVAFFALQVQSLVRSPPRIIKQPPTGELLYQVTQQSNENDTQLFIECEADAEPAPKYRWTKNGKTFEWQTYDDRMSQQPGSGTIVIKSPRDEDFGHYQCFAENEHGIATSNSVFVRKTVLNAFKNVKPKSVIANEGDPYTLQCQSPGGSPKPHVFWLMQYIDDGIKSINDARITVDPEGNLHFSNVTRKDASNNFHYACAAISGNEIKLGNRIVLDVIWTGILPEQNRYEPTLQYVTRKNEVGLRGEKVELYCIYGGTPLPHIMWNKNGKPIGWSKRIMQGNYGKSLIIRHATFEDAGSYTCEASNDIGRAQIHSIDLKVNAAPYFTVEPEIQNAAEDESVEFRCEAFGVPEPKIKWIHNGKPISEAPSSARRTIESNRIVINDLKSGDTGNYGCNATNSFGYVYKDVYLNVLALPPQITEPPSNKTTVDQRSVTLRCRVDGFPIPRVGWLQNGLKLTGANYQTQSNGDLIIQNVSLSDAGEYTCHAINKFGNTEANGSLIVKEHTQITKEPEYYEVARGSPVTFYCNAVADSSLDLKVKWLCDNEEIDFKNERHFIRGINNLLIIRQTFELDIGNYTCVASTEFDEARISTRLIVQDFPNPPRLTGVHCDARELFISWESMGDNRSPILHYVIQYSTSFIPDFWNIAHDKVSPTDLTFNFSMSPFVTYTFRVIAYNKIGPSPASDNSKSCTAKPDVPYKNPDDVKGEGITPTNLVISWTSMPQIEHNGPSFHYRVSWKRDIPDEPWQNNDIQNWQQNTFVVSNQPTFTRYRIKVLAVNSIGESNATVIEKFGYSGEDRPTQAPTNFTLLQVTSSTSAILRWDPVPHESINGHFRGYKVQTWNDDDSEENMREIHVRADKTQILIRNLRPNAINHARVLVFNSNFDGPANATIDFKMPKGDPNEVQSFEAFPLGSTAFLLRWKKPLLPNEELTGYKINFEELTDNVVQSKVEGMWLWINNPHITQAKLAGLKENTTYRLHIVAKTKAGDGQNYFIEEKTLAEGSFSPDRPDFAWEHLPLENGYATIKVTWLPNVNGRPGTHFFAKYRVKGNTIWLQTDYIFEDDFVIIRGLQPDDVYEFVVTSVDGEHLTASSIREVPILAGSSDSTAIPTI